MMAESLSTSASLVSHLPGHQSDSVLPVQATEEKTQKMAAAQEVAEEEVQ
jgi:hypothetical protein